MKRHILNNAVWLVESALQGKASVKQLASIDPDGMPVRLEAQQGLRLDILLRPWDGRAEERAVRSGRRSGLPTVWVIRGGSLELQRRLRQEGISFVDLKGTVHLNLPGLIVDRSGLKPVSPSPRAGKSLIDPFADQSSLALRVLLTNPTSRVWGVRELAEAAGISPSTCSRAVRALSADSLLEFERVGRSSRIQVRDPAVLFNRWTQVYGWDRNALYGFDAPIGDPYKFLPRLKRAIGKRRWALSLQAGAALVAPHASWDRIHLYLDKDDALDLHRLARSAGWRAAEEGALVVMFPLYKNSVWWGVERHRGNPVVSVLQLALDLWHYPLRGREQAEHLLKSQLEPLWESEREAGAPGDPVRSLLRELKEGLARIYGPRMKGLYAHGSYARGEEGPESDLDVVVVLNEVDHYASEIDQTSELISRLSLDYGVSISRVFVTESEWANGDSAFLLNAREEAVPA